MHLISIREHPEYKDAGARFFDMAFGGNNSLGLYSDCIEHSITTPSPLPHWFLCMDQGKIIGGCGLITNDFISRMDLWPWLCAVYVVKERRGEGLGEQLMAFATKKAHELGYEKVYLSTSLDGYYEKCGFTRMEDGYSVLDGQSRIYWKATAPQA